MLGYLIGYSLAAVCAFICAVITYRRKNRMGLITGTMFTVAGVVNLSYLARIDAETYFAASMATSIYFVCLDILIFFMVCYVVEFTQPKMEVIRYKKTFYLLTGTLAAIDAACLIINVFHEILLRYQYHADSIYAIQYMYEAKPAFYFHTSLVCLLLGVVVSYLFIRISVFPECIGPGTGTVFCGC